MDQSVIAKLTSKVVPSANRHERDRGKSKIDVTKLASSSHVLLQYPPLRFHFPNVSCATYDDANHVLILCSLNEILVLPTPSPRAPSPSSLPPSNHLPRSMSVNEGPILGVKFSLDGKILSLQRNEKEIELHLIENGTSFRLSCRRQTDKLLGFFWTDCPTCDLVFITSGGVEIYSVKLPGMLVRLVDFRRMQVAWFVYTHESRMLLLASGTFSNMITGIQFSASGVIKVPKFEAKLESTANNPHPVLSSNQIRIITIYGRIFCLQIDQVSYKLHIFRFFRDAVVQQESISVFSPHIAISVVDNALLLHQTDSKSIFIYDLLSGSYQPISSPSPLSLLPSAVKHASSSVKILSPSIDSLSSAKSPHLPPSDQPVQSSGTEFELKEGEFGDDGEEVDKNEGHYENKNKNEMDNYADVVESSVDGKQPSVEIKEANREEIGEEKEGKSEESVEDMMKNYELYGERWIFLTPNLVVDFSNGYVWQMKLDLKAIFKTCTDNTVLLGYLQRRKSNPALAKSLSLKLIESLILKQTDLAIVSSCLDLSCLSFANSAKTYSSKTPLPFSSSLISNSAVLPDKIFPPPQPLPYTQASSSSSSSTPFKTKSVGLDEIEEEESPNAIATSDIYGKKSGSEISEEVSSAYQMLDGVYRASLEALSPAISPEAMVFQILFPIYEKGLIKTSYLYSVSIELIKSILSANLMVPMSLNLLIVDILLKEKHYFELWQLINNKIIGESKELVDALLEAEKDYKPFLPLAFKMMNALKMHSKTITTFVDQKHPLSALRYVRRNRVEDVNVPPILELVSSPSSMPQVLSSVIRFCSDFIPSFRGSSLQSKYVARLR